MTPLKRRILELIAAAGPLPVSDYMATCLLDPRHGYYTTRDPIGAAGDFVTAPEVSQMFGELVGVWTYSAWLALGRPLPVTLAEFGPGRGTLMQDLLRTLASLDAGFAERLDVALVEASPRLAGTQQRALAGLPGNLSWHASLAALPRRPLIVLGNEIFDALPARQFVKTSSGWRERMVSVEGDELRFVAGPGGLDLALLPPGAASAPDGSVFEVAPQRESLMEAVCERLAADRGAALFFDYGHPEPGFGDTLQAVRAHRHEHPLAAPGEADLTSHVDFSALAAVARRHGLAAHIATQGEFLIGMGLLERAGRLGADASEAVRQRIRGEVERLASPDAMGTLFKVLAVAPPGVALPPFEGARSAS